MLKVGLAALAAMPLTFACARAIDNSGADRAAAAFAEFGVQGLAIAGQTHGGMEFPAFVPAEEPPVGPSGYGPVGPVGPPAYTPVCWTRYVTPANANTLMNLPVTICR